MHDLGNAIFSIERGLAGADRFFKFPQESLVNVMQITISWSRILMYELFIHLEIQRMTTCVHHAPPGIGALLGMIHRRQFYARPYSALRS